MERNEGATRLFRYQLFHYVNAKKIEVSKLEKWTVNLSNHYI